MISTQLRSIDYQFQYDHFHRRYSSLSLVFSPWRTNWFLSIHLPMNNSNYLLFVMYSTKYAELIRWLNNVIRTTVELNKMYEPHTHTYTQQSRRFCFSFSHRFIEYYLNNDWLKCFAYSWKLPKSSAWWISPGMHRASQHNSIRYFSKLHIFTKYLRTNFFSFCHNHFEDFESRVWNI